MRIKICKTPQSLGEKAGAQIAQALREAIDINGAARLILATGASQFETLDTLVRQDVDWSRVTMFHLDEYVGLPVSHKASFRKYLSERFVARTPGLKAAHYVDGEGDLAQTIARLTELVREAPIDVGVIGIGENAHIAFNDPPADFDTREAYIAVTLDEKCRAQQVGEGWFANMDEVPKQAISMTVFQMMQTKKIISCVPHAAKADAVAQTLTSPVITNQIPATMLRSHPDWLLYLDEKSAEKLDLTALGRQEGVSLDVEAAVR